MYITYQSEDFEQYDFFKEAFPTHQACIDLIQNTVLPYTTTDLYLNIL